MTPDQARSGLLTLVSTADVLVQFTGTTIDDRIVEYGRELVTGFTDRFLEMALEDLNLGETFRGPTPQFTMRAADGSEEAIPPELMIIFVQYVLPIIIEWIRRRRERTILAAA